MGPDAGTRDFLIRIFCYLQNLRRYEFLLQVTSRTALSFTSRISSLYHSSEHRLVLLSLKMITTSTAANLPLNNNFSQIAEARNPPPMGRGRHPFTRAPSQKIPFTYPRIPRPVVRQGNAPKATLDSQFQVNASHIQKPLSFVSVSVTFSTFQSLD